MKYNRSKILIFLSFVIIGCCLTVVSFYKSGWLDFSPGTASGFGISPPYINESGLKPGDVIKKKITILRNNPDEDRTIKLILENQDIASWVKFPMGEEFVFKKGDERMAFEVQIAIPDYAVTKSYTSKLMVIMGANKTGGTVSIGLGAQVDVYLGVIKPDYDGQIVLNISNYSLHERLKGKIVIKTEDQGKAYYIHPDSKIMNYLGALSPETRNALKSIGIGISNKDFNRLFDGKIK